MQVTIYDLNQRRI